MLIVCAEYILAGSQLTCGRQYDVSEAVLQKHVFRERK